MCPVRRRQFLIASGALLATPLLARAQTQKRLPVLGILSPTPKPPPEERQRNPFNVRLRELGWVEGETLLFERAYGEGSEERLPELAAMLVAKRVDVICALGAQAAVVAARATRTTPIVFWGVPFPVEQGLIESFARPGRNATGVAWSASPGVEDKRLEFLREVAPAAKRLAAIVVPTELRTVAGGPAKIPSTAIIPTARKFGYEEYRAFPVAKQDDFEPAFAAILAWGAQALSVGASTLTSRNQQRIVEFANRNRLPSAFTTPDYVEAGGLVSYAIDWRPAFARTADYIDRILRGAKPSELPVDLPSRYVTAVNLKTAKALGLKIPQSILLRADTVIE